VSRVSSVFSQILKRAAQMDALDTYSFKKRYWLGRLHLRIQFY